MTPRLSFTPTPAGTELRMAAGAPVPLAAWPLSGHPGAALCQRWVAEELAVEGDDVLLVDNVAIARLTATEAARLDLPPATTLRAVVEGDGIMMQPTFRVALRWTRPGGQHVRGVERIGAWLREGAEWRRLPETLFAVAEAVSRYEANAPKGDADRLSALAALRQALPPAATAGMAQGGGLLGTATIVEADALSLDASGEGDDLRIIPILHRADQAATTALLPEDRQNRFAGQFHQFPTARGVYSLPGGVYVVLSPPLRQALEVVRRAAAAPLSERRAFLREPRAAIRAAIGDEADAALVDGLVLETSAWSERVIGLGLWQPRVLPWVQVEGNDWFGAGGKPIPSAAERGLLVGDRRIRLSPAEAQELRAAVAAAMQQGRAEVEHRDGAETVRVPANDATLAALETLAPRDRAKPDPAAPAPVLMIKPNETARDIEAMVQRRPSPMAPLPACLRSTLKRHQEEGLAWLQANWRFGTPGVLLADDMGLGKTLQGLAFLAWLREGMRGGVLPTAPLLIVAPTGLLENWRAEHARHLALPGLGEPLLAYGAGLKALRRGEAGLDTQALRRADWVLTTYETLRDYDRDFGAVRFAAMLMDEAQKVKTPGIRLTDAAKAMNADFRVALTGTPVENRLADLWCIIDGVVPGHLGDLRQFSRDYEAELSPEKLTKLKESLDRPIGPRPALMKRRLKEEQLPDLPRREDVVLREPMQGAQLAAYEDAVAVSRGEGGGGRVLAALQRLRGVSLHPDPEAEQDDAALLAASARLRVAVRAIDDIAARGERVLVFVERIAMMAQLAGLFQRRYRLAAPPMTINGAVAGAARQARVDRFQDGPPGFDVMLLSPKAGGVGLTLTRANHVVHLERWWNPAVEDQCTGRVLRIGQTRPVTVHIPLAVLPDGRRSYDENLHALLERKRGLMRDALLPPPFDANEQADLLQQTLGEG